MLHLVKIITIARTLRGYIPCQNYLVAWITLAG